jgi:hypothetical protein
MGARWLRDAQVLEALDVDTTCSAGMSVMVAIVRASSGAWLVDQDQTSRLGVQGCLPAT